MDDAAIVAAFLRRLLADRDAGRQRSLRDYQRDYPGYEDLIARELAAVSGRDTAGRGPAQPPATDPRGAVDAGAPQTPL